MKNGPKSSLRPFLHQPLQFFIIINSPIWVLLTIIKLQIYIHCKLIFICYCFNYLVTQKYYQFFICTHIQKLHWNVKRCIFFALSIKAKPKIMNVLAFYLMTKIKIKIICECCLFWIKNWANIHFAHLWRWWFSTAGQETTFIFQKFLIRKQQ